jgi:hypothetical protein
VHQVGFNLNFKISIFIVLKCPTLLDYKKNRRSAYCQILKSFLFESRAGVHIKENVSVDPYDNQALEDESTANFQNVKCIEFKSNTTDCEV